MSFVKTLKHILFQMLSDNMSPAHEWENSEMDITGTSNRQFDVKHKDRLKKRFLLLHLFSYNFLYSIDFTFNFSFTRENRET